MGPIGVQKHLAPYLPDHVHHTTGGAQAIGAISSAPYGSAAILPITYMYMKMMGGEGLKLATQVAILNANYMKSRLASTYPLRFVSERGFVAHEFILDMTPFKETAGLEVEDISKRLADYGFHAPTVSWPVSGTIMIEPTESEDKAELDRFCDALLEIRKEIALIENGTYPRNDNPLKNAPHTREDVMREDWNHPYSRQIAAFPLSYLKDRKFWPSVGRVDNVYGDKNIMCSCPSPADYANENEK